MESPRDQEQVAKIKTWLAAGSINVFGRQFSGKDTQCQRLAELFGGVTFGGGDILRSQTNEQHVLSEINSGKLAPTDDYLRVVLPYFSRDDFKGKPLILSTVGRWHGEETGVMQAAEASGHPLKAVVFINVDAPEVFKRWQISFDLKDRGHREDESEESLRTRLEEFQNKTLPVIEFYRQQGLLIEIDGMLSRDEVTNLILEILAQKA